MPMTPDAKRALSTTIRSLRASLLDKLHDATESAYRYSQPAKDAGLDEAATKRRALLDAWIEEQLRAQAAGRAKGKGRTRDDFRREAEKQAAYTLLNRLVLLRLMEAPGTSGAPLRTPAVLTGGWESRGYKDFRGLAPALVLGDETEGYAFLLQLVFEDLAADLPGLFGTAGVADLVPVPGPTLRLVVDALNAPELASCWSDDMTLGWVYQYWNDPEREALDDKLNKGGEVEPHEIASKTQMFTERYMVDWLLQNSLGPMWLAMCKRHGWTPAVEADGTLAALEQRRVEWRARREAGEVELSVLMPLYTEAEQRWAYFVQQDVPADAVAKAPDSVRNLRILDPAVGSGHFLVIALDLLVALYREEARHRGEQGQEAWSDRAIVEHILEHNLHGIDLDPRAVQIAAAALWLKAKQVARDVRPERINLVAANLRLAGLTDEDPALVELRRAVELETGIPGALTDTLIHALRGADHLGSLLKVDKAVEEALDGCESEFGKVLPEQTDWLKRAPKKRERKAITRAEARETLVERLEAFLDKHTSGDDLGLRLRGEQLAAGVRFVRMVHPESYDLVVANPPYQGTSKMVDAKYVAALYPLGKADLYAAFLLRGLELVRPGGVSSMLTMRGWMFTKQYAGLRKHLLGTHNLRAIHDLSSGAFEEISAAQVVVSVASSIFSREKGSAIATVVKAFDDATVTHAGETARKRAATLCHMTRHTFEPEALKVVPKWPLVYGWGDRELGLYQTRALIGSSYTISAGVKTGDDVRFIRKVFEIGFSGLPPIERAAPNCSWQFYVKGAEGAEWVEPGALVISWQRRALQLKAFGMYVAPGTVRLRDPQLYYRQGIAFSPIGHRFAARVYRCVSVFGNMGSTVFSSDVAGVLCELNSVRSREIVQALNPGAHFEIGDVERLPQFEIRDGEKIYGALISAFTTHESHREPSIEFRRPGASPWRHVQEWAQAAVDRADNTPLPPYSAQLDPEPLTDHLSFALGVALGRFGPAGEGILDAASADLSHTLPHGILFLDTTLDVSDHRDALGHSAAAPLHAAWTAHGKAISKTRSLRDWLALDFFKDVHRGMYENRPIHWPLSSASRTFVAWVNIHRFTEQTLRVLLADHLHPALIRIDGELVDLRAERDGADKKAARAAEKRFDALAKAREELNKFLSAVEQCADRGPPPTDDKCPKREQDARYAPDLNDGVMINAAPLWPLLDPQWKDPKKWWKELATSADSKDYDWSHLAMRYWPTRVDEKCRKDPSLGVAHGCFWRYHPGRAWSWELRLQDEIAPDFRITEAPYQPGGRDVGDRGDGPHRDAWLHDHPDEALAAVEREVLRRMGRSKSKKLVPEMRILETGLWTDHPEEVWALELRVAKKQRADFHLLAPDEPEARAAFEAQHPRKVEARRIFLEELQAAQVEMPEEAEDEEAEDEEQDVAEDEVEEDGA